MAVMNPPEKKLEKRTSVHWLFFQTCFLDHFTEVRFDCFLSGEFITAIVVNPPERKLAKRTSVHCTEVRVASFFSGGFTTMTLINPLERNLAKRTSVHCAIAMHAHYM